MGGRNSTPKGEDNKKDDKKEVESAIPEGNISNNIDDHQTLVTPERPKKELKECYPFIHVIVKNLQAKNIKSTDVIGKIKSLFREDEEVTDKITVKDKYSNLFINLIGVRKPEEKREIKELIEDLLIIFDDRIELLQSNIIEFIENLGDYDELTNEDELLDYIASLLQKHVQFIEKIEQIKEIKSKEPFTFEEFANVFKETNFALEDNLVEYLIYKIKKEEKKKESIYHLSFETLYDIAKRKVEPK